MRPLELKIVLPHEPALEVLVAGELLDQADPHFAPFFGLRRHHEPLAVQVGDLGGMLVAPAGGDEPFGRLGGQRTHQAHKRIEEHVLAVAARAVEDRKDLH